VKFNPITKYLFTDDNFLIKKLDCPYGISWSKLSPTGNESVRRCNICEKSITDTRGLADEVVLKMARNDSTVCLKVDVNQTNIRVVNRNV